MLQLVKTVLQSFGVGTVITAIDGEEAFHKFCDTNPDLVITDWMMTPVNGIELSNKIRREKDSPNPYVPILLMTGFSETTRVLEARDEGITELMVKPFNTRDLYRRLHRIIEQPRQFVRSNDFFGPDRRRKQTVSIYTGKQKRRSDLSSESMVISAADVDLK